MLCLVFFVTFCLRIRYTNEEGVRLIKLDDYEKELIGYAQEIVYYLQKSGVANETAKDISQDVLVKMLETHPILSKDKIRAWMYRVAIRKYIDTYRHDRLYSEILQREFFKKEEVIEITKPDYQPLYDAIHQLKKDYRLALDLFYFQQLTIKEIANLLGKSVAGVKVTLMRGRHQLRRELEKEGYSYEDFK